MIIYMYLSIATCSIDVTIIIRKHIHIATNRVHRQCIIVDIHIDNNIHIIVTGRDWVCIGV